MAIELITGLPGHGKSLYAISRYILSALNSGRMVYHCIDGLDKKKNLIPSFFLEMNPLAPENLLHEIPQGEVPYFYKYIEKTGYGKAENLGVNSHNEKGEYIGNKFSRGCLIIIDEAQKYFPSSIFNHQPNIDLSPYLSEHRHYFHDILFITQHQDLVFTGIRRMVEYSYLCVNNKNFGSSKSSRIYTFNRDNIDMKLYIAQGIYTYDKRMFNFYDSYKAVNAGDMKEVKKSVNLFKHPKMFIVYFIFAFIVFMFVYNRSSGNKSLMFGGMYGSKKQPSAVVSGNIPKQANANTNASRKIELPAVSPELQLSVPPGVSAKNFENVECAIAKVESAGKVKSLTSSFGVKKWVEKDLQSCY